jgi:hypothetical protein
LGEGVDKLKLFVIADFSWSLHQWSRKYNPKRSCSLYQEKCNLSWQKLQAAHTSLEMPSIILLEIKALIFYVIMLRAEVANAQVEQSRQLHIYHH